MKKVLSCFICLLMLCGCSMQEEQKKEQTTKSNEKIKENDEQKVSQDDVVILDDDKTIQVGETFTRINDYLDEFDVSEMESGVTYYENEDIIIIVKSDKIISHITLKTDRYVLNNGLGIGMDYQTFVQIYNLKGDVGQSYDINCHQSKIRFLFSNKKISKIDISIEE